MGSELFIYTDDDDNNLNSLLFPNTAIHVM